MRDDIFSHGNGDFSCVKSSPRGRLLRKLNITNAADADDLPFKKYGEHSTPLAASRDNYLIVVDDAIDAATTLAPETSDG